jgi:hypothetical protein
MLTDNLFELSERLSSSPGAGHRQAMKLLGVGSQQNWNACFASGTGVQKELLDHGHSPVFLERL